MKKISTIIGMSLLASLMLVGCNPSTEKVKETEEVKESVKKEKGEAKVVKVEVEKPKEKETSFKFNSPSNFVKEWNMYAKENDLDTFEQFNGASQSFDNGITITLNPSNTELKEIELFQVTLNPSIADEKIQQKAVEITAKSLFSNISKDDIEEWQDALDRAKKVDTSKTTEQKPMTVPVLKIGETHKAVFLYRSDDKETKQNEEFLMIQIEKENEQKKENK